MRDYPLPYKMILWMLLLVGTTTIISQATEEKSSRLLFLQTLTRHGDRAPSRLFFYDDESNWPGGVYKLTKLGKKQLYEVGKYLRSRYKGFVTSNPNEVLVNSSSDDRCLRTAECLMASFYAPDKNWMFEEDFAWQPIPINYIPAEHDKYLDYLCPCPLFYQELDRLFNTTQNLFLKHKTIFDNLSNILGLNLFSPLNILVLYDTLLIEQIHNISIPHWANQYWKEIKEVALATLRCYYDSPTILRLRAGPLLGKILENMERKIKGLIPDFKVQVFSAHDNNLGAVLLALNITDMPQPPFSATIIFELHEMADKTNAVRFLYLNSTMPEKGVGKAHILLFEGCSEFCPLEYFEKKVQHLIPINWEEECRFDLQADACAANSAKGKLSSAPLLIISFVNFMVCIFFTFDSYLHIYIPEWMLSH